MQKFVQLRSCMFPVLTLQFIMVGSGKLGEQPVATEASLPESNVKAVEQPSVASDNSNPSGTAAGASSPTGAASSLFTSPGVSLLAAAAAAVVLAAL